MAWTDQNHTHIQKWTEDSPNVQIIQHPSTTLFQQFPSAMVSPAPSVRPGHVKEDLVELMMLQNAQMHQVIMNNMTMSALSTFGHTTEAVRPHVVLEEDPEVYHHHYLPAAYQPYPAWVPLTQPHVQPLPPLLLTNQGYQQAREPAQPAHSLHRNKRPVPPPPPPSATGTVGADIPPATEYYDATERRL